MGVFDRGILAGAGMADIQPGGILGGYSKPSTWDTISLIASGLQDANAGYRGQKGGYLDANMQDMQSQQMMQMRQKLLTGLSSQDPTERQKAYQTAALFGVDTKPFQQQQASAAVPKLLQSMQPSTQSVAPTQAALPDLPGQTVQGGGFNFDSPGLSSTEALAQSNSPELQQLYAPKVWENTLQAEADANKPFDLSPGQHRFVGGQDIASLPEKPNFNAAFNTDGTPNKAFQSWEMDKMKAQQAPAWANVGLAQQRLAYDQQNKAIDPKAVDLGVSYFIANGGKFPPTARSPALQNAIMSAAQDRMSASGQTMDDLVQKHQALAAGTKAVSAFDTGKQGDTVRSLNVSVQHLDKLRELGVALKNGDVNMINAARQKFAEAFGGAAPTNWDAAKAIVADEVAKGVIGGQTAQSDRETLAATLKNSRSPEQADGAIGTFQDLLGGQLRGLRQQYKSSTGRDDFNGKLFKETVRRLDPQAGLPAQGAQGLPRLPPKAQQTKVIGGQSYVNINGQWYHQ